MKTDLNLKAEYMATFPDIAKLFPNIEAASGRIDKKRLFLRQNLEYGIEAAKAALPPCACEIGIDGTGYVCPRCVVLESMEAAHDYLTD